MKKVILILIAAFLCPLLANAQSKQISDIFDKYEKKKYVESIVVTPSLLSFMNDLENKEEKELLAKIKEIRIMTVPTGVLATKNTENDAQLSVIIRDELEKHMKAEKYFRVVKVNDGEEMLEVYISENEKGVLLFLASSKEEFTVISIFGNIDKTILKSVMDGTLKLR